MGRRASALPAAVLHSPYVPVPLPSPFSPQINRYQRMIKVLSQNDWLNKKRYPP
ncbi:hypothetical protein BDV59DRAFT_177043 [Aspergillus ambiguus]|uniref:uncharacterized protein n=1 Tax=Aspergillus ambiguus TaxID=176160 RepID=UPI003CCD0F27